MYRYVLLALALLAGALSTTPALANEPIVPVHQKRAQAGPYTLTVGFSRWPVLAERSLDFLFMPEGGIDGLSGTLTFIDPSEQEFSTPLSRHPRQRSAWGLDVSPFPGKDLDGRLHRRRATGAGRGPSAAAGRRASGAAGRASPGPRPIPRGRAA